jgi:phage terminase large subunit-like protein
VVDPRVYTTRGATWDNAANMPESFIREIEDKYAGTRLGRQELEGEILNDIPGALWTRESIDDHRIKHDVPDLERIIVSVDPAASSEEGSDETGIVVVGYARDADGYARGYVLEDGSIKGTPEEWASKAVSLYRKYSADKIVAEKNNGGEMVSSVMKAVDRTVPIKLVHASRGKYVRAEPIAALYEQGRVHHTGIFDKLEDQMCLFSTDNLKNGNFGSPDRVDALVWGLTEIFDKITSRPRKAEKAAEKPRSNFTPQTSIRHLPTGWMA